MGDGPETTTPTDPENDVLSFWAVYKQGTAGWVGLSVRRFDTRRDGTVVPTDEIVHYLSLFMVRHRMQEDGRILAPVVDEGADAEAGIIETWMAPEWRPVPRSARNDA